MALEWLRLPALPPRVPKKMHRLQPKPSTKPSVELTQPRPAINLKARRPKQQIHIKPSLIQPTLYHRALPRLHPQPLGISMMIKNRIKARQRRLDASRIFMAWLDDAKREIYFERLLVDHAHGRFKESADLPTAVRYIASHLKDLSECFDRETARVESKIPNGLIATRDEARKSRSNMKRNPKISSS